MDEFGLFQICRNFIFCFAAAIFAIQAIDWINSPGWAALYAAMTVASIDAIGHLIRRDSGPFGGENP